MYEDAESVLATVTKQAEQARERAVAAVRFRQEVDTVRGSADSPDRTVRVTVDASGLLRDLDLRDGALQRRGRDLAQLIRETVYAAQRDAAAVVTAKAADTFGADSPSTTRMRQELDLRFVEPAAPGGSVTLSGVR